MTIQTINVGNLVNDGLGDDLRTAFQKVNANFSDLSERLTITGQSFGNGANVFRAKVDNNFEFRSIISGDRIQVEQLADAIQIINTAPAAFQSITTNAGIVQAAAWPNITLQGGEDIDIVSVGGTITVDNRRINNQTITDILSIFDFGPIPGNFLNVVQFLVSSSNTDFGSITLPGTLRLDFNGIV